MSTEENKPEMSVDEILSSIKDVISNEKSSSDVSQEDLDEDDNVYELTDILEDEADESSIKEENSTSDNNQYDSDEDISDSDHQEEDFSMEAIISDTIQKSLNEWFEKNLRPIVEESVRQEVSKLFKKRN